MSWLGDYAFAHDGLFVVPIEGLAPEGLTDAQRDALHERGSLPEGWTRLFDDAFRAYWARAADLARRSPGHWFPPRVQNVCIVTRPAAVRPYFQPFYRSSWLLYASDFDPAESNVELGAFLLLQVEREGLMRQLLPAFAQNLSYWLVRGDEEVELFRAACARSSRPDAEGYRALADALPWLRELHHRELAPARIAVPGGYATVPGTGLEVRRADLPRLEELLATWWRVAQGVADQYYSRAAGAGRTREHAGELLDWLRAAAPRVLVTGAGNAPLWDPDRPEEVATLRAELTELPEAAARSLRADLEIVGRRSQRFVDALRTPGELPAPDPRSADQNGLCYMHLERGEIAYNLREPGMQRLREPAPPYERPLLAARAVHEWGHRAAGAGWVRVPEESRARWEELAAETADLHERILGSAPSGVRRLCAPSLARLARGHASTGAALVRFSLGRIEDFLSNLLSQRFLEAEERETYVRNQVRSLAHEIPPEGTFERLARYAYEYQYLRFSAVPDPLAYFLRSTWFPEQYLVPGIVTEDDFRRLLAAMGRLCDLYAVDERRFRSNGDPRATR